MRRSGQRTCLWTDAFTILEVLVAIAVLALIMGILLQLSGNTLQATRASHRQMEASQRARTVMDALSSDLDNLILVGGHGIFIRADGTTTELAFLTRSRGPAGTANFRALAVAYVFSEKKILRRTSPVLWTDRDLVDATIQAASSATESVLSEGILDFQISLALSSGNLASPTATGDWITSIVDGNSLPDDFHSLILPSTNRMDPVVQALVFSLASLDAQMTSLPEATALANALASVEVPANELPREAWDKAISEGLLNSFPKQMAASLRTAQFTWQFR